MKGKSFLRVIFFSLLAFLIFSGGTGFCKEKKALLLGLREDIPLKSTVKRGDSKGGVRHIYKTLWIYRAGNSFGVMKVGGLIVPRSSGFWKVDVKNIAVKEWYEDQILAGPLGKKISPKPLSYDPKITVGSDFQKILFANSDYLSIYRETGGYMQRMAHPWLSVYVRVSSIDNPDDALNIEDVEGDKALVVFLDAAEKYLEEHPQMQEKLLSEPNHGDWGIIRNPGKWTLLGFINYSYEVFRGSYAIFPLSVLPSRKLVLSDNLPLDFKSIKEKVPDAVDAFSDDEASILVVMTKKNLRIYNYGKNIVWKKPARVLSLKGREIPVMIEWVSGQEISDWHKNIGKYMYRI